MSELKVYIAYEADDFPDETEFYLKSEADKVIAEKDKEIEELRNEADVYKAKYEQEYDIAVHNEKQLSAMRIELRHQKYKRCLAMAEACMHKRWRTDEGFDYARSHRHMNKWMELAEKFKEAK